MSDTLVHRVGQRLAVRVLHEGQEGFFKHGRSAEHQHGQAVVPVTEAQGGRQHRVVPADLRATNNGTEAALFSLYGGDNAGQCPPAVERRTGLCTDVL